MRREKTILVVADPVEKWDPIGETTFCLLAEASQQKLQVLCCMPDNLRFDRGRFLAIARTLIVAPKKDLLAKFEYDLSTSQRDMQIDQVDAILLRKDPPVDLHYQHHLQLLVPLEDRVFFCNRPSSLLKWNEKLSILAHPALIPNSLVHVPQVSGQEFDADPMIRKNLVDSQAKGVRKLSKFDAYQDTINSTGAFVMDQAFNPNVAKGDKRILIINGTLAGGFNRIPKKNEWRSNTRFGSTLKPLRLSKTEDVLVRKLCRWARKEKLFFVGLDLIDGHLSEINLTSVRGIIELRRAGGPDLAPLFWRKLLAKTG